MTHDPMQQPQGAPMPPPPTPEGAYPPPPGPQQAYGQQGYAQPAYAPAPYGAQQLPPVLQGQVLADWGSRVGAMLIDAVFIIFTIGIGFIVNLFLLARDGEKNGMTLGKQVVGQRVIKEDGTPVTLGFAALREVVVRWLLLGIVGSFFLGIPGLLDVLWPLWDEKNQTLHDKMVSTYVVKA